MNHNDSQLAKVHGIMLYLSQFGICKGSKVENYRQSSHGVHCVNFESVKSSVSRLLQSLTLYVDTDLVSTINLLCSTIFLRSLGNKICINVCNKFMICLFILTVDPKGSMSAFQTFQTFILNSKSIQN